ncbi:MAG: GNAT family N-acetyltransferase [Micropepsaceae bacterium]
MQSTYGVDARAFDVEKTYGKVLVRPLCRNDRPEWDRLWTAYLEFYRTVLFGAQYDLTFERFLDPTEPMFAFLAEHDGAPRGLVHIVLHRSAWVDEPSCYLQDLYVDETLRGAGMGRAMIEHVYHVMKSVGGTRVHWLTHESNTVARRLYEHVAKNAGFIQYVKAL